MPEQIGRTPGEPGESRKKVVFRPATEADLAEMARVLVDGRRAAYAHFMPRSELDVPYEQLEAELRRQLFRPDTQSVAHVACLDEAVVGFVAAAPYDEAPEDTGEVYRLFVREEYQRLGIGTQLLRLAVQDLQRQGLARVVIWAFAESTAPAYYERLGGQVVERFQASFGGKDLDVVVFAWEVGAPDHMEQKPGSIPERGVPRLTSPAAGFIMALQKSGARVGEADLASAAISHNLEDETIEAKARWFQSLLGGAMNKDTVRQIVVAVAVVVMIVLNILANALPFNNVGTGVISDWFEVYFVPAGYVFSIWGLIYIGLLAYAVYQALPAQRENPRLRRIGYIFVASSVANVAWLFFWHYFWKKPLFPLTLVDMLILLGTLIAIYLRLGTGRSEAPLGEKLAVRLPFSIYLGWITVATIANVTDLFYHWGWRPDAGPGQTWAVVVLAAAVAIAALMSYFRGDVAYLAVLVWAFVGIALNPLPRFDGATIVTTGAWVAAGLVAVLAVGGQVLRRRRA